MATYPRLNPATLANLLPVIDDPADTEDSNKLAQVDLQTRRFVYDYLFLKFDSSTEKLKPGVVDDTTLAGKVKGSTGNAGTQQGIVQGTISTPDLRDDAVTGTKIADGTIGTDHIADDAINGAKIADDAVTADHIANNCITADQLAANCVTAAALKTGASDGAVTTSHIRDDAVTADKLAANSVTGDALPTCTSGQLLVGGSDNKFAVKTLSGDATLDNTGRITLVSKNECELVERANNATSGGGASSTTWHVRGNTPAPAWIEAWRVPTGAFATIGASGKVSLPAGTYVVEATAPAYKVGKHICRLVRYNVSDVVQETFYGTSEVSAAADGVQTRTRVCAKITVGASTDYLKLEHYCEAAEASDGLGLASSSGGTYEVYATMHIRQVA